MSYTQTFHTSITVSGSRTVSYPKSESGGTMNVSYTVSEPINVTVQVDTSSYDQSVGSCKYQLDLVTGAVVATQALQVQTKNDAAKEISNTVLTGFFKAVRSELGQQMAELRSQSDACLLEMGQLGKACAGKRDQMQEDFQRISGRYAKLFEELDRELQRRLLAIDQPAFDLMQTNYLADIGSRLLQLPGVAIVAGREGIQSVSLLQVARARRMMGDLVHAMKNYMTMYKRLEQRIEKILRAEEIAETKQLKLPVLIMECDRDAGLPGPEMVVVTPDPPSPEDQPSMDKAVDLLLRNPQWLEWRALESSDRIALDQEFNRVVTSHFARDVDVRQQREVNTILSLYRQTTPLKAVKC